MKKSSPNAIASSSISPAVKHMDLFAALEAVFHHEKVTGEGWPPQTYVYLTWNGEVWIHNEDGTDAPWQLTKADYLHVENWHIWKPS